MAFRNCNQRDPTQTSSIRRKRFFKGCRGETDGWPIGHPEAPPPTDHRTIPSIGRLGSPRNIKRGIDLHAGKPQSFRPAHACPSPRVAAPLRSDRWITSALIAVRSSALPWDFSVQSNRGPNKPVWGEISIVRRRRDKPGRDRMRQLINTKKEALHPTATSLCSHRGRRGWADQQCVGWLLKNHRDGTYRLEFALNEGGMGQGIQGLRKNFQRSARSVKNTRQFFASR